MKRLFYNLVITFKNKELIFWTFAFPIILGTLFFAAFSNIKTAEEYEPIKVAVVKNEDHQIYPFYIQILGSLSEGEGKILDTAYYDLKDEATAKAHNGEFSGVIVFDNDDDFPKLVTDKSGIDQTIVQNIMTEIEQAIIAGRPFETPEIKNTYSTKYEYTMIEYYSLLAMACLYGGMIATKALDKRLANMTASGKRIAVASISKAKIILESLFTSYLVQLIGLTILFSYMTLVLRIDFGENLPFIILFTMIGALAGLALGTFVSAVFKTNENNKDGILTGFTMVGCFFAGMMGPQMKYVIDANLPILNKLNPAAIITDGYYALSTYGPSERYILDIVSLLIFSGALSLISILILRRQKYDNL